MSNFKIICIILIVIYSLVLIRTAWLCDDTFFTLRTIDNFVNGYGLNYNPIERVQAYTHPLWMLFLSIFYFFTREAYFTTIILSITISIIAVCFLYAKRFSKNKLSFILSMFVLLFSKAYIDFSTSGLENPLSHLLLLIYIYLYISSNDISSKTLYCSLAMAFLMFNRLDLALIVAPSTAYLFYKFIKESKPTLIRIVTTLLIGYLPIILWIIFSVIYYGFPFPNTYYAKLHTGIKIQDYCFQGFLYIIDSIARDPITIFFILSSLILMFIMRNIQNIMLSIGVMFYIGYIIYIGGDFMSGRHFTSVLLVSITMISSIELSANVRIIFIIIAIVLGFGVDKPTILSDKNVCLRDGRRISTRDIVHLNGIGDERLFYYEKLGLLHITRMKYADIFEREQIVINRREVRIIGGTHAIDGFRAGPNVHIIERFGITDPLLSRLPIETISEWKIGHFRRKIPDGYIRTISRRNNRINNPSIAEFYDKLTIITRDNIFDINRFITILQMNLGLYDNLLSDY